MRVELEGNGELWAGGLGGREPRIGLLTNEMIAYYQFFLSMEVNIDDISLLDNADFVKSALLSESVPHPC